MVALTIQNLKKEDTLVPYKLEVTNSQGKNEYEVRLQTDNEPGPGTTTLPIRIFLLLLLTTHDLLYHHKKKIKRFRGPSRHTISVLRRKSKGCGLDICTLFTPRDFYSKRSTQGGLEFCRIQQ